MNQSKNSKNISKLNSLINFFKYYFYKVWKQGKVKLCSLGTHTYVIKKNFIKQGNDKHKIHDSGYLSKEAWSGIAEEPKEFKSVGIVPVKLLNF